MKRIQWMMLVGALAILILCFFFTKSTEGFLGFLGHKDKAHKDKTIFMSVASYRDKECMETLQDMYAKAKYPERIITGICEQNTVDTKENCKPVNFKYHDNIRRITIPHKEAKGPTYARYLCSTLYRGEDYFCQIDSHSTFVKHWDEIAIEEHGKCPTPAKSILSMYPHDRNAYGIDEASVPVMCGSKWDDSGIPTFTAVIKSKDSFGGKPKATPFMSGGFVFAPGKLLVDVPYDPSLDHIFQGEEILYTARAWTTGYDIFCPSRNIVLHHYYRNGEGTAKDGRKEEKSSKFWDDIKDWQSIQKLSLTRVKRILGLEEPRILPGQDPYGLGKQRAIEQFWEFSGLDSAKKTSTSQEKFCS